MSNAEIKLHGDPAAFMAAIVSTAESSRFDAHLVEKDYYCSLLLRELGGAGSPLVFKGGTCISKVYSSFYRLSEDLDYSIAVSASDTRGSRRKLIAPLKALVDELPRRIKGMAVIEALIGRNVSTQYIAQLGYSSVVTRHQETIKIEVGLREPLMLPAESRLALTLAKDPFSDKDVVPPFPVNAMAECEIWAEKARAAMTRRDAAIRDFFDLDYAVRNLGLNPTDKKFVQLLQKKLAVPENEPVNLSEERRAELNRQVEAQLKPVVRTIDFEQFNLEKIWDAVMALAQSISAS
jgi:predicted nucleotidyltransferase component of viral defense system